MTNVEIVKQIYEGGLEAALAPGIEWYPAENNPTAATEGPIIGLDAVLTANDPEGNLARFWETFDTQPLRFHDAGDVVVVEARYQGKSRLTGRDLDAQVCHIWTLQDSRVVRFQQYTDTAQLHAVHGLDPQVAD